MTTQTAKNHMTLSTDLGDQDYISVWAEQFLADKKSQNLSKHTVKFYQKGLEKFIRFCDDKSVKTFQQTTPQFIREYMTYLGSSGLNPGGQHANFRTLKVYFRWFWDEVSPDYANPINKVKPPKVEVVPLKGITRDEFVMLFHYCVKDTFTGERDRAILLVLMDTGLRAQEVCDIELANIDLIGGSMIVKGKGSKTRTVFFGSQTRKQLRRYQRYATNKKYLFSTHSGEKMKYVTIRQILVRLSRKANIKEVSLHDFRRGYAAELLKRGVDLLSLSRLLGHSDLSLLKRYVNQSTDDLHEKYQSAVDADRDDD
jgi:integrase/recombinase XerD